MRAVRIIGRSIASGCKSIFRNFSLSMASITCTMITLILVAIGILLSYNIQEIAKHIESELTIVVFMDSSTSEADIKKAESDFKGIENVNTIVYKSKEEARDDCIKAGGDMAKMCELYGIEALQDSFIIKVFKVEEMNETATTIKNMDHVKDLSYGERTVSELLKAFKVVKNATIVLVVALVLVTTFLISNTIKITIFSRKNEIEIMRLVGTGNMVIKMPFLFEGLILGAIGAVIPIIITIVGYNIAYQSYGASSMSSSNLLRVIELATPDSVVYITSLALLVIGSVVGMFGSVRAVRRFLKI